MDGEYDNPPFVDDIIRNLLLFIVCVCLPQLLGIQSLVFSISMHCCGLIKPTMTVSIH